MKNVNIDWTCNKDEFSFTTGCGATKAESMLANYASFLAPVFLYVLSWRNLDWSILQLVIVSFLLIDMIGGVLTNSLNSMKRVLYSEEKASFSKIAQFVNSKYLFPAIHFHLFIIPIYFNVTFVYAAFWYLFMLSSVVVVHNIPLYMQRPIAMLIIMLSIIVNSSLFVLPAGIEWLAPIFMMKLVLSHGVREEPYRPSVISSSSKHY